MKKAKLNHKRSRIKSLDLRLEDGYFVLGGRLQKTQAIPYRTRHPNSRHEHAQLIIDEMHRSYYHPPTENLLNQVRQEYWIIHGRQAVRSAKIKCNCC